VYGGEYKCKKPERKIPLGISGCRWEDIVEKGIKEIG